MTNTNTRKPSTNQVQEIVRALEEQIVLGWLMPRERLLEEKLSTHFACKKHVIREAIFELERMGLVEHIANKGATVRLLSPEEIRQIYSVREALEMLAAQQILLPGSPEFVGELKQIQIAHAQAVEASDHRAAFHANMAFHDCLFSACGNPYLAEMIRSSAQKVHGARFYTAASETHLRNACQEHWAIIEAIESGDRDRLVTLCRNHIGPSLETYLNAVRGLFETPSPGAR
jgi:DNA-binding GntR family transcriptional regulator